MTNVNYASQAKQYKIEFNVQNSNNSNYKVYVLLSKDYIKEAIIKANLDIEYTGSSTLIENDISGININKNNVLENLYEGNDKEYVQILLDKVEENKYEFNIISEYTNKDVLFRIENTDEEYNYIVSFEKFTLDNGVYKVYYDYQNKISENYQKKETIQLWQILLIILIILIVLAVIRFLNRKNN